MAIGFSSLACFCADRRILARKGVIGLRPGGIILSRVRDEGGGVFNIRFGVALDGVGILLAGAGSEGRGRLYSYFGDFFDGGGVFIVRGDFIRTMWLIDVLCSRLAA